jgi:hypothetical protein
MWFCENFNDYYVFEFISTLKTLNLLEEFGYLEGMYFDETSGNFDILLTLKSLNLKVEAD